jgi:hypothetical protein
MNEVPSIDNIVLALYLLISFLFLFGELIQFTKTNLMDDCMNYVARVYTLFTDNHLSSRL